jgi:hypothetical protein
VQEECRARPRRAGDEEFSGNLLRSEAGACPGGGLGGLGGSGAAGGDKGRGPHKCVFVLHRFCTDLEEYYVSVAKAISHLNSPLYSPLLLLPYL